jgi:hypothetical protein
MENESVVAALLKKKNIYLLKKEDNMKRYLGLLLIVGS